MNNLNFQQLPRCTVDYPLELTPSETATLSHPINILLKSPHLLGTVQDIEGAFQALFDIAEEIAGVDFCAYISGSPEFDDFEVMSARNVPEQTNTKSPLLVPAQMTRRFGKPVHLDAEASLRFLPTREGWRSASLVAYPLRRDGDFAGALVFGKRESHPFTTTQVKLLFFLSSQAEYILPQTEAVRLLSFYSSLDPLTHLYNRRYFNDQIEKEIQRSRRTGRPFALLLIYLDDFKTYNDQFMDSAGDMALQEFSALLQSSVREIDTVARLGGEELAVLLVDCNAEGARDLAHRIVDRIGKHFLPGMERKRTERLSASVGVCTFPSDSFEREDLVQKAGQALDMAKSQGGGGVCLHHEIAELLMVKPSESDISVQKIYGAARSVIDMDKFLEILLHTAMQGVSAHRGSIVVTTPKGDITLRAAIGFSNGEKMFSPGSILPAGAVTSWVVERGEPLVVSGQGDMPLPMQQKKNGYRSDSFLSVPLVHEGRLLGAIHLTNKRDKNHFTVQDLEAFTPISGEIARILDDGMAFQENVRSFSTSILLSLSNALELRFPFLSGHGSRVRDLSVKIGAKLGLEKEKLAALGMAAALHDIGIVGIPAAILAKDRKLSENELEATRKHPFLGAKLLEGVSGMENTRRFILEHHEFYDGSGYPHGLRGEKISLGARILSLAEFYDSIISERPHRGGLRPEEAMQLIRNNSGTLFDREAYAAFSDVTQGLNDSGKRISTE